MSAEVRRWRLHRRTWHTIGSLAREINPLVRGWMQYYGAFYRSALLPLLRRINSYLMRWLRKKYKRLASKKKARGMLGTHHPPSTPGSSPTGHGCPIPGGQDDRSRVTGDCYARICGSPGVRFPRATRPKPAAGGSAVDAAVGEGRRAAGATAAASGSRTVPRLPRRAAGPGCPGSRPPPAREPCPARPGGPSPTPGPSPAAPTQTPGAFPARPAAGGCCPSRQARGESRPATATGQRV
jgi:hypothetical protein